MPPRRRRLGERGNRGAHLCAADPLAAVVRGAVGQAASGAGRARDAPCREPAAKRRARVARAALHLEAGLDRAPLTLRLVAEMRQRVEIVERADRSMLLAIAHDLLRALEADAFDGAQLLHVGVI